jgi:hypothetical protein
VSTTATLAPAPVSTVCRGCRVRIRPVRDDWVGPDGSRHCQPVAGHPHDHRPIDLNTLADDIVRVVLLYAGSSAAAWEAAERIIAATPVLGN